jgi:hypothetical protein
MPDVPLKPFCSEFFKTADTCQQVLNSQIFVEMVDKSVFIIKILLKTELIMLKLKVHF